MKDTIVFISPDFDSVHFEKIAETLCIQRIATTDNINLATVIIKPHKQSKNLTVAMICKTINQELTIAKLAEQQVEKNQKELEKLIEQSLVFHIPEVLDFPDIQIMEPKQKKKCKVKNFVSQRDLKRYNQTKQNINQRIFSNRTKHK